MTNRSWRLAPAYGVLSGFHGLDHAALAAVARHTAELLGAPVAAVNLVTDATTFRVAGYGLPAAPGGIPTAWLPCQSTVAGNAGTRIADLHAHPSGDRPLLRGGGLRSYAGVPLAASLGRLVGTLCVLDVEAGRFTDTDLHVLASLARDVTALLGVAPRPPEPR